MNFIKKRILKLIRRIAGQDTLLEQNNALLQKIESLSDDIKRLARPKRLFISTGYFSTWIASSIARDSNTQYDNYLLITIDRQSKKGNIDWALKCNPDWMCVNTIDHEDYYVSLKTELLENITSQHFHEVFYAHPDLYNLVKNTFISKNFCIYDEGVATRLSDISQNCPFPQKAYYIQPYQIKESKNFILQIKRKTLLRILSEAASLYEIPEVQTKNNILYIMPGIDVNDTTPSQSALYHLNIISYLKKQGFTIWLARHPRVPTLPAYLIEEVQTIPNSLPLIDLFIHKNRKHFSFIVGVYSTILCDSKYLHSIQALQIPLIMTNERQNHFKLFQDRFCKSILDVFPETPLM